MNPEVSQLAAIDYTIIFVYVVGMLAVGAYYTRFVNSAGDLFLAGRALPFWAVGVSIVASDIGAIDLVFGSGSAHRYGIAQANFDWIGSVPAVIFAAFVFVPYYWRSGVYTIPEFLGRRYNEAVQLLQAGIWLAFMTANIGLMLWTAAVILNKALGWDYLPAMLATAVLVGVYTVAGGLAAIVMTDVMQVVVMFVGTSALVVLSIWEAGGWSEVYRQTLAQPGRTEDFFRLLLPHTTDTPYPWTGVLFGLGLVMSTAYFVGNQAVLQRALGAKSEWDAKAGMLVAGFLKLLIPLLMFLPGLAGRALYPQLTKSDEIVPLMVRELMPSGLLGLMFAAFFAAIMSSIDSYLNSCSTMFISDIYSKVYRRVAGREVSDLHALRLGRLLTVVLLVVGVIVARIIGEGFETMYVALQTMLSFFQGPTLAILLLGILWARATRWGGLAGLVVGVVTAATLNVLGDAVFPSGNPFLFVSWWAFVVAMVTTVVVSLVTPPEPAEKIRGLVLNQVLEDVEVQALLSQRMESVP